jgi:hypothetical protein
MISVALVAAMEEWTHFVRFQPKAGASQRLFVAAHDLAVPRRSGLEVCADVRCEPFTSPLAEASVLTQQGSVDINKLTCSQVVGPDYGLAHLLGELPLGFQRDTGDRIVDIR